jgi:glycosyltransferase involved in cell wall biosynthesis
MRLIFANKFYYRRGGADIYALETAEMLQCHGHEVVPFAMVDTRNQPTPWSRYFVSNVVTEGQAGLWQSLRTAGRFLWSFEAARKFGALLDEVKPDLVHVHSIYHQIGPSILREARRRGVPVVMTAHDYGPLAPGYALYHDGAVCQVTRPHAYWRAVAHRCVRGSYAMSILCAAEHTLHRALGAWQRNVDLVIAPSRFVQAQYVAYGWPADRIVHVPHYVDLEAFRPVAGGNYVLFVGRLSEEKGVETLIRAAALRPDMPVQIVGEGPDGARLRALAQELGTKNVTFRGFLAGAERTAAYAGARLVVVSSVWYEPFGLIVLEAYASGKPVVATQIGGLTELVEEGQTGLHASAGDAANLAEQMGALWDNPALAAEMGQRARQVAETQYNSELHYKRLMAAYEKVSAVAPAHRHSGESRNLEA